MKLIDTKINKKDLFDIAKECFGDNERIEFDSMINIRPRQNNRSRDVLDPAIRNKITIIVNNLVEP